MGRDAHETAIDLGTKTDAFPAKDRCRLFQRASIWLAWPHGAVIYVPRTVVKY